MSSGIMKVCHVYQLKPAHTTHTHLLRLYMALYIEYIYRVYMKRSFIYALGIFSRARVEFIRKQDADSLSILSLVALCGQFN